VYISNRSGFQSPWIVPLDGGEATEIVQENVEDDVAPTVAGSRCSSGESQVDTVTCELPRCSNRREPRRPRISAMTCWTPDGQTACVDTTYRGYGQCLPTAAPARGRDLRADTSPIVVRGLATAWLHACIEFDVVLLSGVRP
jgi:hypothetical protein